MSSEWAQLEMTVCTALFTKGGGERSYTMVETGEGPWGSCPYTVPYFQKKVMASGLKCL